MDDDEAIRILVALSSGTRFAATVLIADAGPAGRTPAELAAALAVAPNLLSAHLAKLVKAGVATVAYEGGRRVYRVVPNRLAGLAKRVGAIGDLAGRSEHGGRGS